MKGLYLRCDQLQTEAAEDLWHLFLSKHAYDYHSLSISTSPLIVLRTLSKSWTSVGETVPYSKHAARLSKKVAWTLHLFLSERAPEREREVQVRLHRETSGHAAIAPSPSLDNGHSARSGRGKKEPESAQSVVRRPRPRRVRRRLQREREGRAPTGRPFSSSLLPGEAGPGLAHNRGGGTSTRGLGRKSKPGPSPDEPKSRSEAQARRSCERTSPPAPSCRACAAAARWKGSSAGLRWRRVLRRGGFPLSPLPWASPRTWRRVKQRPLGERVRTRPNPVSSFARSPALLNCPRERASRPTIFGSQLALEGSRGGARSRGALPSDALLIGSALHRVEGMAVSVRHRRLKRELLTGEVQGEGDASA